MFRFPWPLRSFEGFLEFQSLEDHLGEDRGAHANLRDGAVRTDPLLVDLAVQAIHDEPGNLQTGCLAIIAVLEFSAKQPLQDLLGSPWEGVLGAVAGLFRWLTKQRALPLNPAAELELPRVTAQRLPQPLTEGEVARVLASANPTTKIGLRARAIRETGYSTGLRRMELARLRLSDLDLARGVLAVREGKGRKDRVVPIGERAIAWLEQYLDQARPALVVEPDDGTIFITGRGRPFHPNHLSRLARDYVVAAGVAKRGACHLLRHTMATAMLEHGADIRVIQEILGHARLTTTQVYARVSIRLLKAVHTATHPAARLSRPPGPWDAPDESGAGASAGAILRTTLAVSRSDG